MSSRPPQPAVDITSRESSPASRRWLRHYDPQVPAHLDYPHIPIFSLLEDSAAQHPDKSCAIFYGKHYTYRQINTLADRFAAGIRQLGIRKGSRVALLLPNCPQYLIAYYGLLKAGAVIVPLNPLYTEQELTFHLTDSEAEAVITLPMFLEKTVALQSKTALKHIIYTRLTDFLPFPLNLAQGLREAGLIRKAGSADLVDFRRLQQETTSFTPEPVDPGELALLMYSGGTTGTAKGIMLSHYACVANACQLVAWGRMEGQERLLAVLPLFHGFGMSVTMNAPIMAGGEIVLMPRFKVLDVVKAIQKYRPDFFIGVPTMFVAFTNLPDIGRYDLSSLKGIFVGAAPLTRGIKEGFEAKTGGRMIEGYGLTESVTACMANPYQGQHKIGSIGIPFPDVDMKIVSLDDGHDLPAGELGEIVLRSPTLMLGYYKKPEETKAAIVDGWLHTGDIGYMDEDGYFYITDRKKELIIIGGFNVFPREIDEVLYQHPKVKEGTAVGIPDAYSGERIKVFIVLKDGETATPEEFFAYFRERLVPYKVPAEIEFRSDLPKSMIGKILRRSLREESVQRAQTAPASAGDQPGKGS